MRYRALGDTGLQVSVVGFGVWTVSTSMWEITDDEFGDTLLKRALELGINFFDTADVYGDGKGETVLAKAFSNRRDEVVYATKFGYDFLTHPGIQPGQRERPHDWSPEYMRRACEASLKRLGTDRIDLYQLHNPRVDALQRDDLFAALEELKAEGKILSYGVALGPALKPDRQVEEGEFAITRRRCATQIIFNMLEQQLGGPLGPLAQELAVPLLVRVPHASGILEGTYSEETQFAPTDHRSHRVTTDEMRKQWLVDGIKKLEMLRFAAEDAGRTPGQMAIQWLLAQPGMTALFPNIYDSRQLEEFAGATDTPEFTTAELDRVRDLTEHDFYLREPAGVA